ncbi:toprim domain-containing protein [Candidatus Bathyarchaeota archaeon]|jgi:5S rRNA maturation endonuclease (ribonuclease M5)|nr:toprim domain-containing protein [Candidatus Bathyarchaeota archaeon]MCK4400248.1 toprim domain-containing protein [Candidatus Bathyarchaeota archaeon]MCK4437831.1 toprim domain-containing protein [Candidatus Bathyarchaeota archaeon]
MRSTTRRKKAIEEMKELLYEISDLVDVVLVEGPRDVESLKRLGYTGEIVTCAAINVNDYDLMTEVSGKYRRILILTDFDQEGLMLNRRFAEILEHEGVKVEKGLRRMVGRITAALGIYAIESLDNIMDAVDRDV